VIGVRLGPLLVEAGHEVAGMTRSAWKADAVRRLGAQPVICDVYDSDALTDAVAAFAPDMVMHQLTDLPDSADRILEHREGNNRIRTEGTRNLIAAARATGAERLLAQSIAWRPRGGEQAVEEHEQQVLDAGGVVLEYGQLYGPGTYYEDTIPEPPRIHVDEAARWTVELLDAPPGVVVVAEEES
jgi:nucleoside-diphosphate-sugar epimerase